MTKTYTAKVIYTPPDDPVNEQPNGANPAWIILTFEDGSEEVLHHTFNVKHEDTWIWEVDFSGYFGGRKITFEGYATDPGSDDLTFEWDFGDGGLSGPTAYYNNGMGPEPVYDPLTNSVRSPWGTYQFSAVDKTTHTYTSGGTYTVTLTVSDDDGGITTFTLVLVVVII